MALEYGSGWWVPVMRGFTALIFGLMAILLPDMEFSGALLFFGFYFAIDGVLGLWLTFLLSGVRGSSLWPALIGILDFVIVTIFIVWSDLTSESFMLFIAFWAFVTGAGEAGKALYHRSGERGDWWLFLAGGALVVLALALVIWPHAAVPALMTVIGVFLVLYGAGATAIGFKERGLSRR